jgi:hypothetical protein
MSKLVYSGSMEYLRRKYKDLFSSPRWKTTKIKEWSDGKYTIVFEYMGND